MELRNILVWIRSLCLCLPLLMLAACETGDDADTAGVDDYFSTHPYVTDPRLPTSPRGVGISPTSASVTFAGQDVIFQATGGKGWYRWDVADSAKGSVTPTAEGSPQAVYRCLSVGPNTVIAYDSDGNAAMAAINGSVATNAALSVTATPASLAVMGAKSVLAASGGSAPYNWAVSDITRGTVSAAQGASVYYTRGLNAGDNAVTCTDNAGAAVIVIISQP